MNGARGVIVNILGNAGEKLNAAYIAGRIEDESSPVIEDRFHVKADNLARLGGTSRFNPVTPEAVFRKRFTWKKELLLTLKRPS